MSGQAGTFAAPKQITDEEIVVEILRMVIHAKKQAKPNLLNDIYDLYEFEPRERIRKCIDKASKLLSNS